MHLLSCAAHRSVVEPGGGGGRHGRAASVRRCGLFYAGPGSSRLCAVSPIGRFVPVHSACVHCMEPSAGDHYVVPEGGEGSHISTVMHCVEPENGEGIPVISFSGWVVSLTVRLQSRFEMLRISCTVSHIVVAMLYIGLTVLRTEMSSWCCDSAMH